MVISYFDDLDCRDSSLVEAAGWMFGKRFVIGHEDESRRAAKIDRVLTSAVCSKGMKATRAAAYIGERGGRPEDGEATA